MMNNQLAIDFCIEIDFQKETKEPHRIFTTLSEMTQTFQTLDENLVQSIHSKLEPALLLEDIESGSVKLWLKQHLEALDDEAIKNLNWKRIIGSYLVKAKYFIVNFLEGKMQITDRAEIEHLEYKLMELAKETDVLSIPSYQTIEPKNLLQGIQGISGALKNLDKSDKIYYVTKDGSKTSFNLEFDIIPEVIEELFIRESIESKMVMIIKVKKPDYLGESQWQFKHENKIFDGKVLDIKWLEDFQSRKIDIRPGDSIKALVRILTNYGYQNEVVSQKYFIEKVMDILPYENSQQLKRRVETHIFLCILAYHLLVAIEKTLLNEGIHTSWLTVKDTSKTHQVATVILSTTSGEILKIRRGVNAEPPHLEIYKNLKIPSEIMKPTKTWHIPNIVTERIRKLP